LVTEGEDIMMSFLFAANGNTGINLLEACHKQVAGYNGLGESITFLKGFLKLSIVLSYELQSK
jgi:hypothetical protein